MSENPLRLAYLFDKYATGGASGPELEEFWQLVSQLDEKDTLPDAMKSWWNRYQGEYDLSIGVDGEKTLKRILQAPKEKDPNYLKIHHTPLHALYRKAAVAAIFLLLLGSGMFWYINASRKEAFPAARITNPAFKNDVMPGVNGATLTLASGTQLSLNNGGNGVVAQLGNSQIIASHGVLSYLGTDKYEAMGYNTLATHRGQQFSLRLSDGSAVVLDAGSSITYPVTFKGNERSVEINGQAWFEIAKDAARPFFVKKGNKRVEVLGTQFNVHAYDDEVDSRITLVEGSIRVDNGTASNMLTPGQQAVLSNTSSGIRMVVNADVDEAIAWKNGQFEFRSSAIDQVLRDAARWYDIEIEYSGEKPTDTFTGGINRAATLTELLSILEMSNVHFKLEGRKLTVYSK
jgi:hypothetical protein